MEWYFYVFPTAMFLLGGYGIALFIIAYRKGWLGFKTNVAKSNEVLNE